MSEYWQSTKRHMCPICRVWMSAHPRSIAVHNASAGHVERKSRVLEELKQEQKRKEDEERQTRDQLALIQAQARAALIRGTSAHNVSTAVVPASPLSLPPRPSHEQRLREESKLAAFIQDKLTNCKAKGPQQPHGDVSAEHDPMASVFLHEASYFENEASVPEGINSNPEFQKSHWWKTEVDEATGLPIYLHSKFNVFLWTAPACLAKPLDDANVSERETRAEDEPPDVAPAVDLPAVDLPAVDAAVAAGVPGPWQVVAASEQVFKEDVSRREQRKRLDPPNETTAPEPRAASRHVNEDDIPVEREQRKNNCGGSGVFRTRRKLKKEE